MSEKTEITNTSDTAKLPPFIPDGDNYITTKKENILIRAVEGLGFGWGAAVALGTIVEFFADLRKPRGTGRFRNLIVSETTPRQILDGVGMLAGAAFMISDAVRHNRKIEKYKQTHAEALQAEKMEKDSTSAPKL